jgi:hypothetical protein
MTKFGEVLEIADALSLDEQEDLLSLLTSRVREQRRAELAQTVREARHEFRAGRVRVASPAQIMKKILS